MGGQCRGQFYNNIFCSNSLLNCGCTPHAKKGCVVGKEDVYWFDSCGNKEEVAQDCDYAGGTKCAVVNNQAVCKSLDCPTTTRYPGNSFDQAMGGARKNGESWCVYEGKVGQGYDLVGTRHSFASCVEGVERLTACKDLREEICVTVPPSDQQHLRKAKCIPNEGVDCVSTCNEKPLNVNYLKNKGCCNQRTTCSWISNDEELKGTVLPLLTTPLLTTLPSSSLGNVFVMDRAILPKYVYGLLLYFDKEDTFTSDETFAVVSSVSQVWGVTNITAATFPDFVRGILGTVPASYTLEHLEQLLVAIFDAHPSDYTPEELTEAVKSVLSRARLSLGNLVNAFGVCLPHVPPGFDLKKNTEQEGQGGQGAGQEEEKSSCDLASVTCRSKWKKKPFGGWECKQNCECMTPQWIEGMNDFCQSLGDCGAGYNYQGTFTQEGISVSGDRMPVYDQNLEESFSFYQDAVDGLVIDQVPDVFRAFQLASTIFPKGSKGAWYHTEGWAGCAAGAYLGPVGCGAGRLVVLLSGWGKVKEKTHVFTCKPWTQPIGGQHCDKCDDDLKKPCTEYRCESLGRGCKYLEQEEQCVYDTPRDVHPPVIQPWPEVLTPGFTLSRTSTGYYIQPNVPPFTSITFGIKTDEPAVCRIESRSTNSYDEMTTTFGATPGLTLEHKITFGLPGGEDYTYYARCKDHRGTATLNEYTIQFQTNNQPDQQPPQILLTAPASGVSVAPGIHTLPLTVYLNEISVCRWSTQEFEEYESMPADHAFDCDDELIREPNRYYQCAGELTDIQDNQINHYFIRCKDTANNPNGQSYPFDVKSE